MVLNSGIKRCFGEGHCNIDGTIRMGTAGSVYTGFSGKLLKSYLSLL